MIVRVLMIGDTTASHKECVGYFFFQNSNECLKQLKYTLDWIWLSNQVLDQSCPKI